MRAVTLFLHFYIFKFIKSKHFDLISLQCYEFTKDGALKGSTPAEVVQLCDITFSCVSDPSALKDVSLFKFCFVS